MATLLALREVGKAIKSLDQFPVNLTQLGTQVNANRCETARRNLINILFSNGYELQRGTYKVIKSTQKRNLL